MESYHVKAIQNLTDYFCDNFDIEESASKLLSKGLLSFDQLEEVEKQTTETRKVLHFLKILRRRGSDAYEKFCEVGPKMIF